MALTAISISGGSQSIHLQVYYKYCMLTILLNLHYFVNLQTLYLCDFNLIICVTRIFITRFLTSSCSVIAYISKPLHIQNYTTTPYFTVDIQNSLSWLQINLVRRWTLKFLQLLTILYNLLYIQFWEHVAQNCEPSRTQLLFILLLWWKLCLDLHSNLQLTTENGTAAKW
jgi:hypothetical protein